MIYCARPEAIPVESGGQVVAALCSTCDTQLPAEWLTCDHAESVDISSMGERPGRKLCNDCGATYWRPWRLIPSVASGEEPLVESGEPSPGGDISLPDLSAATELELTPGAEVIPPWSDTRDPA